MYKKLSQISEIATGYTFRESLKNEPNGDISVIQAKNVLANIDISNLAGLASIYSKSLRNPYFLQYNDILLVSRGSGPGSFRSAVFGSHEKNIISSSSANIIRITDVMIIPKYLSLYLNSPEGQKSILQIVTGASYIQSILLKNLSALQIPIPPIHVQKSIIALHENIVDQEEILERKQDILKTIINSTIINLNKK